MPRTIHSVYTPGEELPTARLSDDFRGRTRSHFRRRPNRPWEPAMTTPTITTHELDVPGATITYDVHGALGTGTPLLIVGCPMGADGFATLARHFPDRPVVTYDPRGVNRSTRSDGAGELTPGGPAAHPAPPVRTNGGAGGGFARRGGAGNAPAGGGGR